MGTIEKKKRPFSLYRAAVVFLVTSFFACASYIISTAFLRDNPDYEPTKQLIEIHHSIKSPGRIAFGQKERLLILCLGLDENRDEKGIGHTKGSRTDTIFILNLDRKASRLGILSIPRDTWIESGDYYGRKINSVYAEAFLDEYESNGYDYEKAKTAGLIKTQEEIEEFLDIDIDYYVLMKIKACKEMVDAIGGLPLDVERDMEYDDYWGNLHIHLEKGRQRLNGDQAVGYARFRYDEEGDWGRIRRQQQVIQAMINELKKPTHIMHINKIAKVIKDNLDTNLSLTEIIDIANVYRNFDRENIARGVISGSDDSIGDASVIIPDYDEIKRIVRRVLRSPSDILPEEIRVGVINCSSHHNLGEIVAAKLREDDFYVEIMPDPEEIGTFQTKIIDHFQNPKGAEMVEEAIGFYQVYIIQKPPANQQYPLDFTLRIGDDYIDFLRKKAGPVPKIDKGEDEPGTFEVTTTESENLLDY